MDWLIVSFLAILHNPDTYGHLFYISILVGTILLTKKNKYGWLTRVVGDIGWVVVGYFIGMNSIILWSSVFALNDLRGYLLWKWSENEDGKLQGQGKKFTKTYSPENKRSIRTTGRGRGESAYGLPRRGHNVKCNCSLYATMLNREQEYQVISQPRRARASKVQRKARANSSGSVETTRKRVRKKPSVS